MTQAPLTRRQRQILDFFQSYTEQTGISPTLEEVAQHFGIHKVTIFGHVSELERKGMLKRAKKGISRGLQLVETTGAAEWARDTLSLGVLGTIAAGAPIETLEEPETLNLADLAPRGKDVYVLRVKGRHLWNPSNFGICVLLFLAPETVAALTIQWGNFIWPLLVIWILGSVIIWRAKRIHISVTYVLSFLVFAFLRSWITGDPWRSEISPITGPMYQLFVFFMITDPKTTVKSIKWQRIVVFLVAFVEMLLRLNHVVYAPLYALFLVGPTAMLIEIWLESRRSIPVKESQPA